MQQRPLATDNRREEPYVHTLKAPWNMADVNRHEYGVGDIDFLSFLFIAYKFPYGILRVLVM